MSYISYSEETLQLPINFTPSCPPIEPPLFVFIEQVLCMVIIVGNTLSLWIATILEAAFLFKKFN